MQKSRIWRRSLMGAALLAAMWAGAGRAEAPDEPAKPSGPDPCAALTCRAGGYQIKITVDKDHTTLLPVTRSPYVLPDGSILIFPGETLIFQFTPDGGKPGVPKFVAEYAPLYPAERDPADSSPAAALPKLSGKLPKDELAAFPPGTFIVSFGQHQGEAFTSLIMESNLPQTLKFDAILAAVTPDGYVQQHTSTCPLMPNMMGDENWPYALGPMILTNFHFLEQGAGFRCE